MASHGTASKYANGKCRCDDCKKAWREYFAAYKARRGPVAPDRHGRKSTYDNDRCRCDDCLQAAREWRRRFVVR